MKGHLTIIPATPVTVVGYEYREPFWTKPLTAPPGLSELQGIVAGHIELVPGLTAAMFDGELQRCVAFCNEDGKRLRLPRNYLADTLWQFALRYNGHPGLLQKHADGTVTQVDHLVGDIAVITGDDELMEAL